MKLSNAVFYISLSPPRIQLLWGICLILRAINAFILAWDLLSVPESKRGLGACCALTDHFGEGEITCKRVRRISIYLCSPPAFRQNVLKAHYWTLQGVYFRSLKGAGYAGSHLQSMWKLNGMHESRSLLLLPGTNSAGSSWTAPPRLPFFFSPPHHPSYRVWLSTHPAFPLDINPCTIHSNEGSSNWGYHSQISPKQCSSPPPLF